MDQSLAPVPSGEHEPSAEPVVAATVVADDAADAAADSERPSPVAAPLGTDFSWETFFGRKALGWVAVVLLLLGVAFFLRYAFENNWIGPMGQIALGVIVGTALVIFGWWGDRHRDWDVFSQIISAAGLLLLYLCTFAAFGYYTILTQQAGGLFLLLIVAAAALLSVLYNARALALMTVFGGLVVPLLLDSPHDLYQQFFSYLVLLSGGVLLMTYWRHWPVVSRGGVSRHPVDVLAVVHRQLPRGKTRLGDRVSSRDLRFVCGAFAGRACGEAALGSRARLGAFDAYGVRRVRGRLCAAQAGLRAVARFARRRGGRQFTQRGHG